MPKPRIQYICRECGYDSPQYFGRCPSCQKWDSFDEQVEKPTAGVPRAGLTGVTTKTVGGSPPDKSKGQARVSFRLSQIADQTQSRWPSGYGELDRVLGGGIVPGSLVLIGGEPGIGKSTLLLQVANMLARKDRILYVSAEESGQQVKLRSQRLGVANPVELSSNGGHKSGSNGEAKKDSEDNSAENFYLLPETDLEVVLRELEALKPNVAVIDSIQTIYFASLTSAPGSVAQVRECTSALMQVAKRENITLFIVGHVTKDGALAGPRVLEHLVDTVLYFEGDRFASHRLLRSMKNRFGATHEMGVFEMVAHGLREVDNPSELFLGNRDEFSPGTSTTVTCEGTRPILVEIQALVSPASFGSPRRTTTGVDNARLQQILAVLEKRVGIPLSKLDVILATVGGLKVDEPAADLSVAIAVVASFRDRVIDARTVLLGEVGLGGQVRPVSQLELRLREAAKLGFKRAIIPKNQPVPELGMEIIPVAKVIDAIIAAIPATPAQLQSVDLEEEDLFN
ncbi:DNA repair protein RadA [Microcoleus asticus]|uniref:DNA repair protein RadA n=1 Tax=Microcoleus asticus IPMA8 TaxID=2563858 RepID=A0ABX2CPY4_9CYAN|nr:DNA repair protein RadA [Microcoleus asticus]NQE32482.1 DNA repair protein RadA [Microcoleus asticus IPMA8]